MKNQKKRKKYLWISNVILFLVVWSLLFLGIQTAERDYQKKQKEQDLLLQAQSQEYEQRKKVLESLQANLSELQSQQEEKEKQISLGEEEKEELSMQLEEKEQQKQSLEQELFDLQRENEEGLQQLESLMVELEQKQSLEEELRQQSIAASEEESRQQSIAASEEEARQQSMAASQTAQINVLGKAVYLTFDDGPSYLTASVLDILDQYQVKATFFVTYKPEYEAIYKEIVNRGHAIGIHTATHDYNVVYASYEQWLADFTLLYDYVYQVTGVKASVYRFPGGSCGSYCKASNLKSQCVAYLSSLGMQYFDWNVVSGDGAVVTAEESYNNVIGSINKRNLPVVLMHDGTNKETTVQALPSILQQLRDWGYTFDTLNANVAPIQQEGHWDY